MSADNYLYVNKDGKVWHLSASCDYENERDMGKPIYEGDLLAALAFTDDFFHNNVVEYGCSWGEGVADALRRMKVGDLLEIVREAYEEGYDDGKKGYGYDMSTALYETKLHNLLKEKR